MLLTLLLGDEQARWEVDTMVYGIPSHLFVTKQQVVFIKTHDSESRGQEEAASTE